MGTVNELSKVQEDFRELLRSKPAGGLTIEEEAIQGWQDNHTEDQVVVMACAVLDIYPDLADGGPKVVLRDAIDLLDHLDTMGMELRFKKNDAQSEASN